VSAYPQWLLDLLGPSTDDIVDLFPECIRAGHERARDAQDASRLRQKNPYGGTSWLSVYDEFVIQLGSLPGASLYKPANASFQLVVLHETLIYPSRVTVAAGGQLKYGRMKPTRLRRAISALPALVAAQAPFDFSLLSDNDQQWVEPDLFIPQSVAKQVLLVPYASNADAGLVAAAVGEGNLLLDGYVDWVNFHSLELGLHHAAPQAVIPEAEAPRFDNGVLPQPSLSPRRSAVQNPEAADALNEEPASRVDDGKDE
jgi:hypothetical protein